MFYSFLKERKGVDLVLLSKDWFGIFGICDGSAKNKSMSWDTILEDATASNGQRESHVKILFSCHNTCKLSHFHARSCSQTESEVSFLQCCKLPPLNFIAECIGTINFCMIQPLDAGSCSGGLRCCLNDQTSGGLIFAAQSW